MKPSTNQSRRIKLYKFVVTAVSRRRIRRVLAAEVASSVKSIFFFVIFLVVAFVFFVVHPCFVVIEPETMVSARVLIACVHQVSNYN